MSNLNVFKPVFNSKATYVEYRKAWKEQYVSLSTLQRELKKKVKEVNRNFSVFDNEWRSHAQFSSYNSVYKFVPKWGPAYSELTRLQYDIINNTNCLNEMLETLKVAKKEAAKQMLQSVPVL